MLPQAVERDVGMDRPSISNICDSEGRTFLYTNGCSILRGDNVLLENGDNMTIIEDFANQCDNHYNNMLSSTILLPAPCKEDLVYYISLEYLIDDGLNVSYNLYATSIDVIDSGSMSEILSKHKVILTDTLATGNIHATRHANGRDWWICVLERKSNCYNCLLLNENGFHDPIRSCTGFKYDSDNRSDTGSACFSADGSTYVRFNYTEGLNIYDFDNNSGIMVHRERIHFPDEDFLGFSGVAISSNSRFVYAAAKYELFQFDLMSSNVSLSKILIDSLDLTVPAPTLFMQSHLGPDGKVYITGLGNVKSLHVINEPNQPGQACDLAQHSLLLPELNGMQVDRLSALPNIPYFGIEPDNSPCDSLLSTDRTIDSNSTSVKLFPNPSKDIITVITNNPQRIKSVLISDISGKVVEQISYPDLFSSSIEIETAHLEVGLYFVVIKSEKGMSQGKFIKM